MAEQATNQLGFKMTTMGPQSEEMESGRAGAGMFSISSDVEESKPRASLGSGDALADNNSGAHRRQLDEADEYGEINQDPDSHVTVKIYAGLSHAYLNLSLFLRRQRGRGVFVRKHVNVRLQNQ